MTEPVFDPKYITFDCYGTLTRFGMTDVTVPLVQDRVGPDSIKAFIDDFRSYRGDEVLGPFKLYPEVLRDSFRRTCDKWKIEFRESDAQAIIDAVPTWGPHPDVPGPLKKLAQKYPLVILSNAVDAQLKHNVEKLGAPFHAVYSAEQAGAYKPRFQAFEYLLDQLACDPGEILHVSSHIRYDLIPAYELGITHKVYVNRGYDPSVPFFEYQEIGDLTGLPALVGL